MTFAFRALGLALALLAIPATALAHVGSHRPEIEGMDRPATPTQGPRGRAELTTSGPLHVDGSDGRFSTTFSVENRGDGPLRMYRVGPLVDDVAPSFPTGVRVHSPDLETRPIPPGGKRTYTVEWTPGETLARQGSGIVVIESDSAAPGAADFDPPLRVAVELDRRPAWLRALPTLSVALPLLLVAFSLLSFRLRRIGDRAVLRVATIVTALGFGADLALVATMNRTLGRADGSFGLQHVERRLVAGLDVFLGLDGLNAPLLLGLGAVSTAGVAALPAGPTPRLRVLAGLGVAFAAGKLFVLSQSVALSTIALGVAVAGAAFVLASVARFEPARRGALASIGLALAVGFVTFAAFGHLVTHHARAEHPELGDLASSVTDLARVALHDHGEGPPRLALGLLVASAVALLGMAPVHAWTERAAHPVVAPLAGLVTTLGAAALLRGSFTLFPAERELVSSALAVLGVASLATAAAGLFGQRTLARVAASAALASGGLAALAYASRTVQGMEAAVILLAVRAVALPLVLLLGATLAERSGEPRLGAHGGLGAATPRWSLAWVFAVASAAGLPGGAATGGLLLASVGTLGRAPVDAALLAVGVAGLTVAFASAFAIVRGPRPAWWVKSLRLEAQGGRPSDLRGPELLAALVLVGALALALAFPRFWFGTTGRTLLDVFRALEPPGPTQVS